mmetsp:Transcript_166845/g.530467  ORF Transcript_166845/g.530467 Transcript_166845/m.530467 type:complete len:385 (+) Transcript_166845:49-1203(+)
MVMLCARRTRYALCAGWVLALMTRGVTLELFVSATSLGWSRKAVRWDTSAESADVIVRRLEELVGGRWISVHLDFTDAVVEWSADKEGSWVTIDSPGQGKVVRWSDLPGTLHAALSNTVAEAALDAELAPYSLPGESFDEAVGIFILQSPGHRMWQVQTLSIRSAWEMASLPPSRIHVLVHGLQDWRPHEWRKALGGAWDLFGGLHWCGGYNRYPVLNPRLMKHRMTDNYWNKVFVMVKLLTVRRYKYVVSLDDDVMLQPSTLAALVSSGPRADSVGCGVVVPLTQNGIPSAELWAEAWLDASAKQRCELAGYGGCSLAFRAALEAFATTSAAGRAPARRRVLQQRDLSKFLLLGIRTLGTRRSAKPWPSVSNTCTLSAATKLA